MGLASGEYVLRWIQSRPRWFWARLFGGILVLAPSITFMCLALSLSSEEDSTAFDPFLQYLVLGVSLLLVGHFFMRQGVEEEERRKIKALIREVLQEKEGNE